MPDKYTIDLAAPAISREVLDEILLSARLVAEINQDYFRVPGAITVGYLYLVNPEHAAHDASALQPILCTLAYDSERLLYLVTPHGDSCLAYRVASTLYEQL